MTIYPFESRFNEIFPPGTVLTETWLARNGIEWGSIEDLLIRSKIIAICEGVYYRPGTEPNWQDTVASLQLMRSNLTVGGIGALRLQGWLPPVEPPEIPRISLYGFSPTPAWLNQVSLTEQFAHKWLYRIFKRDLDEAAFTLWHRSPCGLNMRISGPERALLEVLADVPLGLSFHEADQLIAYMGNRLSAENLASLLGYCHNVDVKRLLLWLADRHSLVWRREICQSQLNLGRSKRRIARQGALDQTYRITVPSSML